MMDDLTAFQRDVLYVIAGFDEGSPPHGLAIKGELEQHYSGKINHGRLYPNLDDLTEMAFSRKAASMTGHARLGAWVGRLLGADFSTQFTSQKQSTDKLCEVLSILYKDQAT